MTIYYDAFLNGLIPVRNCKRSGNKITAIVSRTTNAYKVGETVSSFAHDFVVKTRMSGFHQLVKTADIN